MNADLICSWLGLPAESWPPDHYALLGIECTETDPRHIEQCVQQRLACLRPYQLKHPDQVTEALNRLAQAFDCLTNPESRRAYDAALAGTPTTEEAAMPPAPEVVATRPALPISPNDPLAWLFGPWNEKTWSAAAPEAAAAEADWKRTPPPPRSTPTLPIESSPVAAEPEEGPPPEPEPLDAVSASAQSAVARRGLGTKRALYYRIARTRQLLAAWEQAGRHLADPQRKLTRKVEAVDLLTQLEAIRRLLQEFPPLLGQAGQPGYSVVALARQPMIIQTFQSLLPSQREVLARHWDSGHDLLLAHRRFLRFELRTLKRKSRWARGLLAGRSFVAGNLGLGLLLAALVALNLAWPALRTHWPMQVLFLATVVIITALIKGELSRRSWLERSPPSSRSPAKSR